MKCVYAISWLLLLLSGCTTRSAPSEQQAPTAQEPLYSETVVADTGLVVAMAFTADGRLFYAEKNGRLFLKPPHQPPQLILTLAVAEGNEAGLLGLALHPDFDQNSYLYLFYTVPNAQQEPIASQIVRYTIHEQQATNPFIVAELPASPDQLYHFGGGLSIGPDAKLYLIFGDRNQLEAARDPAQLPGSILRYNLDGSIPADNPNPDSPVYASGIRNGFGLAWQPITNRLYETENGASCDDELNLIEPGGAYGWGVHPYDSCPYPDDGGIPPVYQWQRVAAPTALLFYTADLIPEFQGGMLVCLFNESQLLHIRLAANGRSIRQATPIRIPGQYETCRVALAQDPDGWLYASLTDQIVRYGRTTNGK